MNINLMISPNKQKILEFIQDFVKQRKNTIGEFEVYLVGGAVRDLVLGKESHDLDFVGSKEVKKLARATADHFNGAFYIMDEMRGIYRVLIDIRGKKFNLDFSKLQGDNLLDDLSKRDFTINAMAIDLFELESIIDPFHGGKDLFEKKICLVNEDSISCDPIRILRAVRLSLDLKFKITDNTKKQIKISANNLSKISPERIRDELFRIFDGEHVSSALKILDIFNVIEVIMPEVHALKKDDHSGHYVSSLWDYSLKLIDEFLDLFHILVEKRNEGSATNINKGQAVLYLGHLRKYLKKYFSEELNSNRSLKSLIVYSILYHSSGITGEAEKKARGIALSNVEIRRMNSIVKNHLKPGKLFQEGKQLRKLDIYHYFHETGNAGVEIVFLALADVLVKQRFYLTQEAWRANLSQARSLIEPYFLSFSEVIEPVKIISGYEIMRAFNQHPSPEIGRLLNLVREAQVMGVIKTKDEAISYLNSCSGTKK
ncbi:MAG: CCA tRNA nucleotidyltransferase [Anaerolineaceae bacterium]|nr:CCA tRNA nucleotidyltransferase [Anaerolineaceae bacterium]